MAALLVGMLACGTAAAQDESPSAVEAAKARIEAQLERPAPTEAQDEFTDVVYHYLVGGFGDSVGNLGAAAIPALREIARTRPLDDLAQIESSPMFWLQRVDPGGTVALLREFLESDAERFTLLALRDDMLGQLAEELAGRPSEARALVELVEAALAHKGLSKPVKSALALQSAVRGVSSPTIDRAAREAPGLRKASPELAARLYVDEFDAIDPANEKWTAWLVLERDPTRAAELLEHPSRKVLSVALERIGFRQVAMSGEIAEALYSLSEGSSGELARDVASVVRETVVRWEITTGTPSPQSWVKVITAGAEPVEALNRLRLFTPIVVESAPRADDGTIPLLAELLRLYGQRVGLSGVGGLQKFFGKYDQNTTHAELLTAVALARETDGIEVAWAWTALINAVGQDGHRADPVLQQRLLQLAPPVLDTWLAILGTAGFERVSHDVLEELVRVVSTVRIDDRSSTRQVEEVMRAAPALHDRAETLRGLLRATDERLETRLVAASLLLASGAFDAGDVDVAARLSLEAGLAAASSVEQSALWNTVETPSSRLWKDRIVLRAWEFSLAEEGTAVTAPAPASPPSALYGGTEEDWALAFGLVERATERDARRILVSYLRETLRRGLENAPPAVVGRVYVDLFPFDLRQWAALDYALRVGDVDAAFNGLMAQFHTFQSADDRLGIVEQLLRLPSILEDPAMLSELVQAVEHSGQLTVIETTQRTLERIAALKRTTAEILGADGPRVGDDFRTQLHGAIREHSGSKDGGGAEAVYTSSLRTLAEVGDPRDLVFFVELLEKSSDGERQFAQAMLDRYYAARLARESAR